LHQGRRACCDHFICYGLKVYQELKSIEDFQHIWGQFFTTALPPSTGKVMLTLFWDSHGVILEHCLERGATVNSFRYSEILSAKLKPEILTKRQGLLSKIFPFLHDNARPHTAIHTVQTLVKLGFEVLAHSAYSPDLTPSDYHFFGPLKDALRGRRFTSHE
jgi:histone-lysine N-methyltransferase SETMAR